MMSVRGLRVVGAIILCVLTGSLLLCSAALALYVPDEPSSFPTGDFGIGGVAIDEASGDVYTLAEGTYGDVEVNLVQKFNKEGDPVKFEAEPGNDFKVEGSGRIAVYQIAVDNTCFDRSLEHSVCQTFDPSNGDLYIAALGNVLFKYGPSGQFDDTLSPPGGFTEVTAVAVGLNGEVYAGEYNSGNIYEFNSEGTAMNSGNPVLTGLVHPNELAVNSKGDLYVAQNASGYGSVEFAPAAGGGFNPTPVGAELPGGPYGDLSVAVDQKTNDVFVDNYNSISEFNEKSELVGEPFGFFEASFGVAVNEESGTVYVTNYNDNSVDLFSQTSKEAPRALTELPSEVQETSALLEGNVDPQGKETTYEFEWWEKEEADAHKVPATPETVGSGYTFVGVSQTIGPLTPSTTYHYRLIAKNSLGTTVGVERSFETAGPKPPSAITGAASEIKTASVRLSGEVNPQQVETTYEFLVWSETEADAQKVPASPIKIGSGDANIAVSQLAEGLTSSTVYHYRLIAENAKGTSEGTEKSFETVAMIPTVTTLAAGGTTIDSTVLSGSVNPNGAATEYSFEYGRTSGYGQSMTLAAAGSGGGIETVSRTLENLEPNTTYHYRLVAFNSGGASYGEDHVFTTSANPPPVAVTLPASEVAQNTATLNGTVNPDGQRTRYEFQIGTGSEYGVNVFFDAGSGKETESVALPIGDLQPGTTYHYRIVATSEGGSSEGADQTFTTAIFPTAALSAPPTTALLATPPIAFPTSTTGTTTKTTVTKTKGKKKTKAKKKPKHKARK